MPYKSDKQRAFMHAKHPDIAAKWDRKYGKKVSKSWSEDHPKARAQAFSINTTNSQGRTTSWNPSHVETHYEGKSAILRRPKYQIVASPNDAVKKVKGTRTYHITPNRRVSGAEARNFANAHKTKAKKVKTRTGYEFTHVSKASETRLRHQKKASAVTSLAGGTAGLAGLGLLAMRKPKAAAAATTVGGGIGGVGAFNFASIQNQESKKRGPKQNVYVVRNKKQIKNIKAGTEQVTKGFDMMDYGLSDVHQGDAELVTKALGFSGIAGAAKKVGGALKGSTFAPKKTTTVGMKGPVSTSTTKTSAVSNPFFRRSAGVQRTVTGAGGASTTTGHASKFKLTKLGVGTAATGGVATVGAGAYGANQMGQRKQFGKALGFGAASRMAKHGAEAAHGAKAAKVSTAPRHAGGKAPKGGRHRAEKVNPNARELNAWQKPAQPTTAPLATANPPVPAAAAAAPAPAVAPATPPATGARSNKKAFAGAAAGGTAVAALGGSYEAGRRSPFAKAYNPEAKRMRRNEHTATALAVGAGGAATYGGVLGHRALGTPGRDIPVPDGPKMKGGTIRHPGTGLRSDVKGSWKKPTSGIRGGARTAAKAGALGLGAVGLAVASDRVGSYQHKKGKSYRPLHRITSS